MGESHQHRPSRRHADGPVVGLTGARFGGGAGRRLRQPQPAPEPDTPAPKQIDSDQIDADRSDAAHVDGEQPVLGRTGARFGSSTTRRKLVDQEADWQPLPAFPVTESALEYGSVHIEGMTDWVVDNEVDWAVDESDWEGQEQAFELVRPYSWTKGRTAGRHELAIEALVSATSPGPHPQASPEHQAILGLCQTPRSVAELAALLSVPLGVARVVLGDMVATGSVVVHRTVSTADGTPDLALMQRVLTCLQRL